MSSAIPIAILGAGIFAKEQHLPAILSCEQFKLAAIYSHTKTSVDNFMNNIKEREVLSFYDVDGSNTAEQNKNLDALLARDDIKAVTIALPILIQPDIIRKCLKAGKHVLCEKPIAETVAEAEKLILEYYDIKKSNPKLIFSIAENWRYEPALTFASDVVKNDLGKLRLFSIQILGDMAQDNKYYNTAWRKNAQYQGGAILDGGVHYAAALRMLVGGLKIDSVSCFSRLNKPYLAPVDTVHAIVKLEDGTTGTLGASFASPLVSREIRIVGENGSVVIDVVNNQYKVVASINGKSQEKTFGYEGVKREVKAFSEAIANGKCETRASAVEALIDVAFIESIITSGAQEGKVVKMPSFEHLQKLE